MSPYETSRPPCSADAGEGGGRAREGSDHSGQVDPPLGPLLAGETRSSDEGVGDLGPGSAPADISTFKGVVYVGVSLACVYLVSYGVALLTNVRV